MNRPIKLLILIILSLSVYFIYNYTNKTIKIEGVDYLHKCFHEVIPGSIY